MPHVGNPPAITVLSLATRDALDEVSQLVVVIPAPDVDVASGYKYTLEHYAVQGSGTATHTISDTIAWGSATLAGTDFHITLPAIKNLQCGVNVPCGKGR